MQAPAQRAAWDTYLTLTGELLPALRNNQTDHPGVNTQLGGVAIRILHYAPAWGEHGPMLLAAAQSAIRLYRDREGRELAALLRAVADRLYHLSADAAPPHHDRGDHNPP